MTEGLVDAARRLAGLVQAMGRPAAIIGGLAVIARVRARATQAVDALVSLEPEDVDTFVRLAREHGYALGTTPERDLREMGLLRLWGPPGPPGGTTADIIVADAPHLLQAVRRAARVPESQLELPVATVEDLVVMKLDANRPIALDDVIAIKDALGDRLDLAYARGAADLAGTDVRRRLELIFGAAP